MIAERLSRPRRARGSKPSSPKRPSPSRTRRAPGGRVDRNTYRPLTGVSDLVAPPAGAWIETEALRSQNEAVHVAPPAGAWIETAVADRGDRDDASRPLRARGSKRENASRYPRCSTSRPLWARGSKPQILPVIEYMNQVAPPVGAWIETRHGSPRRRPRVVAPPVGAWIETPCRASRRLSAISSRPLWARGSKLVALEIGNEIAGRAPCGRVDRNKVALHERSAYKASRPLWARGSKRREARCRVHHGQVAPPAGAWIETVTTAMSAFRPSSRAPCGRVDRNDLSDDGF